MLKKPSLLLKIKSKFILKNIITLAYINLKSVIKLFKYNKGLLKRLDIDINKKTEDINYKCNIDLKKNVSNLLIFFFDIISRFIFIFIPVLVYIIIFFVKGKFNEETLKSGYNTKMKVFVDVFDKYISPIYLVYILAIFIVFIIYIKKENFILRFYHKRNIFLLMFSIDTIHCILFIIKFAFSKNIINKEKMKEIKISEKGNNTISDMFWFYETDIILIIIYSIYLLLPFIISLILIKSYKGDWDDEKIYTLYQLKGIDIHNYRLPSDFSDLSEKAKREFIFKAENMEKYKYNINNYQKELIQKINDIRKKHKISVLYDDLDGYTYDIHAKLPEFIINEKTELIISPNENIYKINPYLFIFKYPKNEFEKVLNNQDIKSIITNDSLDRISIIEHHGIEYISIFNRRLNEILKSNNRPIFNPRIKDRHEIDDIANSEDTFSSKSGVSDSRTKIK